MTDEKFDTVKSGTKPDEVIDDLSISSVDSERLKPSDTWGK